MNVKKVFVLVLLISVVAGLVFSQGLFGNNPFANTRWTSSYQGWNYTLTFPDILNFDLICTNNCSRITGLYVRVGNTAIFTSINGDDVGVATITGNSLTFQFENGPAVIFSRKFL